jgi:ribosome-binding ATPase YchF (GTP1/OBG family)
MPLQVGIVGLPNAGKTTLFNALTRAGAEVTAYASVVEKANVGMAVIPDDRIERLAELVGSRKTTPAAIRVVDVPATSADLPGGLRQADALLAVLDGFSDRADPESDLETLRLEMIVADRDHVERRLEKVRKEAKSGDPARRKELETLEALLAHLESGRPLSEAPTPLPPELEPLTTKPLIPVENGPGGIDAKLEAELAELSAEEAAAYRDGPAALEQVIPRVLETLDLVVFFTANENDAHAWTLRRGLTAHDAAAAVHTDMARGFVRCEVLAWSDLVECGSQAEAAKRGLVRLEGKGYVVQDGDVLQIRFTPPR